MSNSKDKKKREKGWEEYLMKILEKSIEDAAKQAVLELLKDL